MPMSWKHACAKAREIWTTAPSSKRSGGERVLERGDLQSQRSSAMSEGEVRLSRQGEIATVIFDRPAARNAMTWHMYEQLGEACARIRSEDGLRAAVFRGAGGKAFIAGTDIAQFEAFRSGDDGISYEEKMEGILSGIEALPLTPLALLERFPLAGGPRTRA